MGQRRFVESTVLLVLVAGVLLLGTPGASAAAGEEQSFISLITAERRSRGIRALSLRPDLTAVARRHSQRMASEGRIWHNPNLPNEVEGWTALAENVGMGPAVQALHRAFLNSPHHRANLLNGEYDQVGVGVVLGGGAIFVTQIFARLATSPTITAVTAGAKTARTAETVTRRAPSARRPRARAGPAGTPESESIPPPKPVATPARTVDAPDPPMPARSTADRGWLLEGDTASGQMTNPEASRFPVPGVMPLLTLLAVVACAAGAAGLALWASGRGSRLGGRTSVPPRPPAEAMGGHILAVDDPHASRPAPRPFTPTGLASARAPPMLS